MSSDELRAAREGLERKGEPYAVATVVWRRAPTSAHVGDQAVIAGDGRLLGWVGGACVEPAVIHEALRALREGSARMLCVGSKADFGPADRSRSIVESSCLGEGALEIFIDPCPPEPSLLVIGESPVARALADIASRIGLEVERRVTGPPAGSPAPSAHTFAVVASFGVGEEEALAWLLASPAAYVGFVASRRRADTLRAALRARGIAPADLERLHAPAGLDLGHLRHAEIAVSVLAEIVALRAREACRVAEATTAVEDPDEASDPVCGMSVSRSTSRHRFDHAGATFHFCCARCRDRFAADPARYESEASKDH